MALVEGCKHAIEVSIPVDIVNAETDKVAADFQKRVRMPGFRPGKTPLAMVRKNFEPDIRQKVIENLIPKYLDQQVQQDQLKVVSRPDIIDVHYTPGEPLVFKAEFEVAPEFELGEYRGIEVPYSQAPVTDADVEKRANELRERKATFANVEPRPLEDGDFAVFSLRTIGGVDEPIDNDEMTLEVNGPDTMQAFTDALRGLSPGDEKDFEVVYPEDSDSKLAGKTVQFRAEVKGVRKKELPELNDEFAQDLGDFRTVGELRDRLRATIQQEREFLAQQQAKNNIIDKLVEAHQFPVPQAFIDNQLANRWSRFMQEHAPQLDMIQHAPPLDKLREQWGEQARHDVVASLLLGKIAERESVYATQQEVDQQVEQMARQQRQPIPAVRKRLEENGGMRRIADHLSTEKTLGLLFEHARKTAPEPEAAEPKAE